jgi:hypothetical protein
MRWIERESMYGKNRHLVRLETDEERAWTDEQVRIACDNGGDPAGFNCPFGGNVSRREDGLVDVIVYID